MTDKFQSLGRDSGCSSLCAVLECYCFHVVSIPRSGFWVFKPEGQDAARTHRPSFNPSVGILGVQAARQSKAWLGQAKFQSLGRDSGCSSNPPWSGV